MYSSSLVKKIGVVCMILITSFAVSTAKVEKVLVYYGGGLYAVDHPQQECNDMIEKIGDKQGFSVLTSNTASEVFTPQLLEEFDVIVFNNNCYIAGDGGMDSYSQSVFKKYMEEGGRYVGIHCAGASHQEWTWYSNTLLRTDLTYHASVVNGTCYKEMKNKDHPVLKGIPESFNIREEWYNMDPNPADFPDCKILIHVDEDSYGGNVMGYHAMAWTRELDGGGKMFYSAFGHPPEHYSRQEVFIQLIDNAIQWAGTDKPQAPTLTSPSNGASVQPESIPLQWESVVESDSYNLQISEKNDFSTTVVDESSLTTASLDVTSLVKDKTYYWRVRGSNMGGTGGWSEVFEFVTATVAILNGQQFIVQSHWTFPLKAEIYNVNGQKVAARTCKELNELNESVPSGCHIFRLSDKNGQTLRQMTVIR